MITYGVIAWLVPKTYSTTLDTSLDSAVNSFLAEVERVTPLESGKLFDEFVLNQNGVLIQLFDSSNNEIELPSQSSSAFPVLVTSGVAIESDDPAAYRATHSYIFTFSGSDEVYTLAVAGSAQEVDLLKDTLGGVFLVLLFVVLLVAVLASVVYSHYVTKPVLRISDVSKRMAELDFNWKCKEGRIDELGTLAHSLNEMSQRLSASMADLKRANEKLQADIERERALEQAQLDFFFRSFSRVENADYSHQGTDRGHDSEYRGLSRPQKIPDALVGNHQHHGKHGAGDFDGFPHEIFKSRAEKRKHPVLGYAQAGVCAV